MFFRGSPEYALKFARSGRSTNVAPHINKHVLHNTACTASLDPANAPTINTFYLLLSLYLSHTHFLSPSLQHAFYVLRSLSRSHGRVARAALSVSLFLSLSLRRIDTATNPPPPRFFRHLAHTREKNGAEVYVEQPNQSRANGANCSCPLIVVVVIDAVVARKKHAHAPAHSLSQTHARTHIHTYALSFPSFRRWLVRSVGRSPLTRERDTPGWFSSTVPSARWSGRRVSDRVARSRFCVAMSLSLSLSLSLPLSLALTSTRESRAGPRIFARRTKKRRTERQTRLPSCHKALTTNRNTWLRRGLRRDRDHSAALGRVRRRASGPSTCARGATWHLDRLALRPGKMWILAVDRFPLRLVARDAPVVFITQWKLSYIYV